MAKRIILSDGGWYYVEQAPAPHQTLALYHYRRWHPGYWRYVAVALWQAWRRSVPHG